MHRGTSDVGSLSGIMKKKSRGRNHPMLQSWNERLFILYPQLFKIVYFLVPERTCDWTCENPPEEFRRGELNLVEARVSEPDTDDEDRHYPFHISSPSGEITVAASTASQRNEWRRAIISLARGAFMVHPYSNILDTDIRKKQLDDSELHLHGSHISTFKLPPARLNEANPIRKAVLSLPRQKKCMESAGLNDTMALREEDISISSINEFQPNRNSAKKNLLQQMAIELNAPQQHLDWKKRLMKEMEQHEKEILRMPGFNIYPIKQSTASNLHDTQH